MYTVNVIRKINDDLAIAGQVTLEQIQQIASEGYRSVLNLRSPDEVGFPNSEQQQVESLGLDYVNVPVKVDLVNSDVATRVLAEIEASPKPTLVHCSNAAIAAAMALMHVYIHQGVDLDKALMQAKKLGLFEVHAKF